MLTPSLATLGRSIDLPVCLARAAAARVWLKDESFEDSANLPESDVITAEIDSRIPIRSPFGLPVHVVRSRDLPCLRSPSRARAIRRNRGRLANVRACS